MLDREVWSLVPDEGQVFVSMKELFSDGGGEVHIHYNTIISQTVLMSIT